jgi:hypothetical protein
MDLLIMQPARKNKKYTKSKNSTQIKLAVVASRHSTDRPHFTVSCSQSTTGQATGREREVGSGGRRIMFLNGSALQLGVYLCTAARDLSMITSSENRKGTGVYF